MNDIPSSRAGLWALGCSGLGVLRMCFCTDCLRPIAPEVLWPYVHRRSPDRTAVTFVALGDMGEGGDEQTHVTQAMSHVCQQDGCDFVLGLDDNLSPRTVRSVDDPQFQDKCARPYTLVQQRDFWMILGHHDGKRLWTGAQADVDSTLTSPRWRLSNSRYAVPFSRNFSAFVDGRSASVMSGVHFQETLLVARDGLENSAEMHRTSASVDALQTAIN